MRKVFGQQDFPKRENVRLLVTKPDINAMVGPEGFEPPTKAL